jgi:hypothetical protein
MLSVEPVNTFKLGEVVLRGDKMHSDMI